MSEELEFRVQDEQYDEAAMFSSISFGRKIFVLLCLGLSVCIDYIIFIEQKIATTLLCYVVIGDIRYICFLLNIIEQLI